MKGEFATSSCYFACVTFPQHFSTLKKYSFNITRYVCEILLFKFRQCSGNEITAKIYASILYVKLLDVVIAILPAILSLLFSPCNSLPTILSLQFSPYYSLPAIIFLLFSLYYPLPAILSQLFPPCYFLSAMLSLLFSSLFQAVTVFVSGD